MVRGAVGGPAMNTSQLQYFLCWIPPGEKNNLTWKFHVFFQGWFQGLPRMGPPYGKRDPYFERFQNSLWETHTKISNKQLQKATMLFWNIQQLLKLLFSSKRSLKNNLLAQKTTFTKFQEVSKTTFCRKKQCSQSFKKFQKQLSTNKTT